MIKKIKNIFNLTKIFFKSSFQNPYIIDKNTNLFFITYKKIIINKNYVTV